MAATVHELKRCVARIPAPDRFLLALRFGIGGRPQQTDAAGAARLHTTSAVVAGRGGLAVRRLAPAPPPGGRQGGARIASAASFAPPGAVRPGRGGGRPAPAG